MKPTNPEDLKVCDCADCGETLLGRSDSNLEIYSGLSHAARRKVPFKVVAGRVAGRPYCKTCLANARNLARAR